MGYADNSVSLLREEINNQRTGMTIVKPTTLRARYTGRLFSQRNLAIRFVWFMYILHLWKRRNAGDARGAALSIRLFVPIVSLPRSRLRKPKISETKIRARSESGCRERTTITGLTHRHSVGSTEFPDTC